MVAMVLIGICIGGVSAALILSNSLSANFTYTSELPLTLSWVVDPSSGYVLVGYDNLGTLGVVNGIDGVFTNIAVTITVICPTGLTTLSNKMYVVLKGVSFLGGDFTGASGTWEQTKTGFGDITALSSAEWAFNFKLTDASASMEGNWEIQIHISGDPL